MQPSSSVPFEDDVKQNVSPASDVIISAYFKMFVFVSFRFAISILENFMSIFY